MTLLLNTDIAPRVTANIRGDVARIGGTVDQLIDYGLCRVKDINIVDGGFGDIRKIQDIKTARHLYKTAERHLKQGLAHFLYGEKIPRDRHTIILDIHHASRHRELAEAFDASISSNVVEHSPNPIAFFLNVYFVTKKGGYQFHAIPHYTYTYDQYRVPTSLEHMIADFENESWREDTSHTDDYIQSAIIRHGWQKKFHETYPVTYPFMHYHVFDENNTRAIAEFLFEEVTVDIYKTAAHSDNVVLFRNTLNPNFRNSYGTLIERYLNRWQELSEKG